MDVHDARLVNHLSAVVVGRQPHGGHNGHRHESDHGRAEERALPSLVARTLAGPGRRCGL
ncbi:hypothetical protein D3C83_319690 [compost metagenome]